LRKLVIARKISFGSQADAGAKTREILMTTLLTLAPAAPRGAKTQARQCHGKLESLSG